MNHNDYIDENLKFIKRNSKNGDHLGNSSKFTNHNYTESIKNDFDDDN